MSMPADPLTFSQAAPRINVGVLTIRKRVRTQQCPSCAMARKVRMPADWLDALGRWR